MRCCGVRGIVRRHYCDSRSWELAVSAPHRCLSIFAMQRPVGRPKGAKRPTNSVHGLGRGTGQLCGACFRGGGVDGGAWGAVATRGAAWRVGLIGADFGQAVTCWGINCGLVAHTRHPVARQGHGAALWRLFPRRRRRWRCLGGSRSTRSGVACRADWCRFGQAAALGALQGCQAAHQQRPRAWHGHGIAQWGLFPRRVRVGVRVRAKKRESVNHRKSRKYRKFALCGLGMHFFLLKAFQSTWGLP